MSRIVKKGATSQTVYVEILDSTSTTGGRKTGLVFNTSSLTAYYVRNGASAVAITLATLAAASSAWSSGGFKEVDATNLPGIYRLDVPDAALAAGTGDDVVITIKGATGMAQVSLSVQLSAIDLQDTVRGGMTALPNAAAEAAGGLFTRGTGAGQINQEDNGFISVNLKAILRTTLTETAGQIAAGFKKVFDVLTPVFTAASVIQTGDSFARIGAPIGASISVDLAAVKADTAAVKVQTDKLTFTVANQIDSNVLDWKSATAPAMTGDSFARLGAPAGASISADVAGVQTDTTNIKTRIPAALTGAGNIKSDALALNGDATSAANIAKTTRAIARGTAAGASTTSITTSAFSPTGAVADQFKGRIVTFDADTTTTALRGQSTDITASSNSATPTLTVTALTTAPAAGDTFSVT